MADRLTLAKAKAAAQKQRIRILAMPGSEPSASGSEPDAGVSLIPLDRIFTDKALFQNREADFSEESVGRIVQAVKNGSFRMEVFDPVLLWKKPADGRLYVLSGHSRTEAFRRLAKTNPAFRSIPAKTISVAETEAKKIARESNTLSTKESDLERAAYYRNLRTDGTGEKELTELARANEGRNAAYLINLSHLNPQGDLWGQMRALSEAGEGQRTNLTIIGDWTGSARKSFPQLTGSHENEVSRWLVTKGYGTKAGQFSSRQKFMERLAVSVQRNTAFGVFLSGKPLNIDSSITTGNREAEYQQQYSELLKAVAEAEKLLKEKTAHAYGEAAKKKVTQERADEVVKQYAMGYSAAKQKLNALVGSRDAFIQADRSQASLFGLGKRKKQTKAMIHSIPPYVYGLEYLTPQQAGRVGKTGLAGREDVQRIAVKLVLDAINREDLLPWQMPWRGDKHNLPVTNFQSKKPYRGINVLVLGMLARPSNPYYLTYKQAQEMGGQVKKGATGLPVFFYTEWLKDAKGKTVKDIKDAAETVPTLRYYSVFNAHDIEGIDWQLPLVPKRSDAERIGSAEAIVEAMPRRPPILNVEGKGAFYSRLEDSVTVPPIEFFEKDQYYYSVLFHELTHATKHESRLGESTTRKSGKRVGDNDYAREELVAELGASLLCAEAGILYHTLDNSAAYLKSWKNVLVQRLGEEPGLLFSAAAEAQRAADFIMGTVPIRELAENKPPSVPDTAPAQPVATRAASDKLRTIALAKAKAKAQAQRIRILALS